MTMPMPRRGSQPTAWTHCLPGSRRTPSTGGGSQHAGLLQEKAREVGFRQRPRSAQRGRCFHPTGPFPPPQDSSAFPVCWLGAWLGEGRGALGHPVSGVPAQSHQDLAQCHPPSPARSRTRDRTARHLASPSWSPGGGSLLQQMIMEMVSQLHRTWCLHTRCPTREKQFSEMKRHHRPPQPALCREVSSTFNEYGLVCW